MWRGQHVTGWVYMLTTLIFFPVFAKGRKNPRKRPIPRNSAAEFGHQIRGNILRIRGSDPRNIPRFFWAPIFQSANFAFAWFVLKACFSYMQYVSHPYAWPCMSRYMYLSELLKCINTLTCALPGCLVAPQLILLFFRWELEEHHERTTGEAICRRRAMIQSNCLISWFSSQGALP